MSVIEKLKASKLVPVLRAPSQEEGLRLAHALVSGGVKVLEVTMTVPGAVELIATLSQTGKTRADRQQQCLRGCKYQLGDKAYTNYLFRQILWYKCLLPFAMWTRRTWGPAS